MDNISTYKNLLLRVLLSSSTSPGDDIAGELIGAMCVYDPTDKPLPANMAYVKAELDWYKSQDLSIIGHECIENNKIWSKIASSRGVVNSNYGWCIFSDENFNQYTHALEAIEDNLYTKRAIMVYNRPSIQVEWNDDIHAKKDNICTMYTQALVRFIDGELLLNYHVHMRSNDAWYGMRNDYHWHKFVFDKLLHDINTRCNVRVKPGKIFWFCDSLHIYKWAVPMVNKFLEDK